MSWLHLPFSALWWQVPPTKASRQMLWALPFSLVVFGDLSEAVEKDNHKDIPLSGLSAGSLYCVAQLDRDDTSGLWEAAHVTLVPHKVWARALSAAEHRNSGGHGMFLQPKGCVKLASVGQQTSARSI